ncbi:hypothetical protein M3Y99_00469100 [Aphelenchoides fujianensis]|nr:hypothetical protein M3Y99_00469100 [Aphelenchoides fujianensis]
MHPRVWLFLLLLLGVPWAGAAEEEVFESGFSSLQRTYDLKLEDLSGKKNPKPQLLLKNVAIGVAAPPSSIRRTKLAAFYARAVRNLRAAAPNLRTVELNGGFVYRPNDPKNAAELTEEVAYIAAYFEAIGEAFRAANLTVKSGVFNFGLVFSEQVKNTSDYAAQLLAKFGEAAIIDDSDPEGVEALFDVEGTEFRVNFAFITDLEAVKKGGLPKGRTSFRKAAEKFLLPLWMKLMKEAEKHANDPFKPTIPAGITRLADVQKVHLEDFHGEDFYMDRQSELQQLMAGLGVPSAQHTESVYIFYLSAMSNLKQTLPSLKRLRLAGGYISRLEADDAEALSEELVYLRNLLRAVVKAARQKEVEVLGVNFRTVWLVSEANFDPKAFGGELEKRFGYTPTAEELAARDFDFNTRVEDVRVHVFISLAAPVPGMAENMPAGRMPYYPSS